MFDLRLRGVAERIASKLVAEHGRARSDGLDGLASVRGAEAIEAMLAAGFWASLRREEGRSPRISLALLTPEEARVPLRFEKRLPLAPEILTRLAPAVERPGIHLGVSPSASAFQIWGATRTIPPLCLVLEVVEPGLLVVKHQRREGFGKFANVAVVQGEQLKIVSAAGDLRMVGHGAESLLGWRESDDGHSGNDLLLQLGASMRAHGRGGSLLIVPQGEASWRESIVHPISYAVSPPYCRIRDLLREAPDERQKPAWHEALRQTIDGVAGLTAVDGATILDDRFEVLAFGAKIGRREGWRPVEEVLVMEPVVDAEPHLLHALKIGGTRHLSAAQFAHDQPGALALVASQDGRFTTFSWSREREVVCANRVEVLLL